MSVRGTWRYRALAAAGHVERGTLSAESEGAVYATLSRRGLLPLDIAAQPRGSVARAPLSTRDLALGLRILSNLLEAGLPVSQALVTFEPLAPGGWRSALPGLRTAIREGGSLAAALAEAPLEIPPLVIGIARAGEAGAGIAGAMSRAADLTESMAATQAAARAALTYPAVLAVSGAAAIGVLVDVVLPRFAHILADLGQALPATTRLVLRGSLLAQAAFVPGVVLLVAGGIALRAWINTPSGRQTWHQGLLTLPLVGPIRRSAATARTATTLAALIESGVALHAALALASRAAGDASIERRIVAARERVMRGESVAAALMTEDAITTPAGRLIRAGEQSGRLAPMLAHAGAMEQQHADRLTQAAVRLLEPLLILTFAGIVALVAAALLQAVYSVRPVA